MMLAAAAPPPVAVVETVIGHGGGGGGGGGGGMMATATTNTTTPTSSSLALYYRPLAPHDFAAAKDAHNRLFPIDYDDAFFTKATRGLDGIFSAAAFCVANGPYGGEEEQLVGFITARVVTIGECDATDRRLMRLAAPVLGGERAAYVLTLGVEDRFRGRGLGGALVDMAAAHAAGLGCRAAFLHVISYNTGAMALYARRDFWCAGRLPAFYHITTGRQPDPTVQLYDAYLYCRYLAAAAQCPADVAHHAASSGTAEAVAAPPPHWGDYSLLSAAVVSPLRSAWGRLQACVPTFCRPLPPPPSAPMPMIALGGGGGGGGGAYYEALPGGECGTGDSSGAGGALAFEPAMHAVSGFPSPPPLPLPPLQQQQSLPLAHIAPAPQQQQHYHQQQHSSGRAQHAHHRSPHHHHHQQQEQHYFAAASPAAALYAHADVQRKRPRQQHMLRWLFAREPHTGAGGGGFAASNGGGASALAHARTDSSTGSTGSTTANNAKRSDGGAGGGGGGRGGVALPPSELSLAQSAAAGLAL